MLGLHLGSQDNCLGISPARCGRREKACDKSEFVKFEDRFAGKYGNVICIDFLDSFHFFFIFWRHRASKKSYLFILQTISFHWYNL